ncbi:MAG: hypothetical protein JNK72_25590 [Myxococcales bacterium]|nr:hypothetical protein [Myxococcales bacterium]
MAYRLVVFGRLRGWAWAGLAALLGCAGVQSQVRPVGRAFAARQGEVAVYYALAPQGAFRVVGEVRVRALDERAHLDVVLDAALGRVREVGGDTLWVREVSTVPRVVEGAAVRTCGRFDGPIVLSQGAPCQSPVQALELETVLVGTALRRSQTPRAVETWPLPPRLGVLPQPTTGAAGASSEPRGRAPEAVEGASSLSQEVILDLPP